MSEDPPADSRAITRLNEERAIRAEDAGHTRVEAAPMKITFEFTADCNIHCFFCECEMIRDSFRSRGVKKFSMDEAHFRVLADAAFPYVSLVTPTGVGEIFMFPHYDLLLDYAERHDVKLEIFTNGMLMDDQRLRKSLPLLYRLAVSVDGATKATFEHCRTGANFERVLENLGHARDLRRELGLTNKVRYGFSVTLMQENVHEFPEIVDLAAKYDFDEIKAAHLLVFTPELKQSSLFSTPERSDFFIAEAIQRAAAQGIQLEAPVPFAKAAPKPVAGASDAALCEHRVRRFQVPAVEREGPAWSREPGRLWCRFAWREAYISYEGDVSPCDHQNRPVVGNVFRDHWDDIWNGDEYRALRQGLYSGKPQSYCSTCAVLAEFGQVDYHEGGYFFPDKFSAP